MVRFFGPDGEMVLHCYVHDLYDGEQMRPEKLETWRGLRERYGNRDESRVDQGTLLAPAAGTGEATGPCRLTATAANGWHQEGVGSWAGKLASVALSH